MLLICWGEYKYYKEKREILLQIPKEIGLEVNPEETEYRSTA
jgi:hypothetical protein